MSSRARFTGGSLAARRRTRSTTVSNTGDRMLRGLCAAAGLLCVLVLVEVVYQVIHGASPAISRFGVGFVGRSVWEPIFGRFGAAAEIYGTVVISAIALLLATPLGIAIGLYLAMVAPSSVRAVVGPLVEMLAAIPSIVVGFWGLAVLAPFVARHFEPALHSVLGFIPWFGTPQESGLSIFTAGLVLTLMVLPIIAALSRDLFLTVPSELTDGAAALGATRWEVIRGVVLPTTASGVAAATVLGLGRALGEAIAVTQTIGDGAGIPSSVFLPGVSLSSQITNGFTTPESKYHLPSLFYLALILLVMGLLASLAARAIAGRFDVQRALAR